MAALWGGLYRKVCWRSMVASLIAIVAGMLGQPLGRLACLGKSAGGQSSVVDTLGFPAFAELVDRH